jgi:dipeptidyl aminopeptidase/acylaminoacyl peptidase
MQKVEERESIVLENHGQKIFGMFHRPLIQEAPYPTVLMCHGLAGHKTGKYRVYVNLAKKLSEAGIASLRIDFRGSGDSEGEFSEMTLEGEVSDALKALDFMVNDPLVDVTRIGLFGRSIGGTVALLAARHSRCVKSLATWAPIFNGEQWLDKWHKLHTEDTSDESRDNMMRINGQVPGYDFFKQLFTLNMEEALYPLMEIPLLHIHGERDHIVDMRHARYFERERKKASAKTQFLRLQHSDHDFSDPKEMEQALTETVKWFKKNL